MDGCTHVRQSSIVTQQLFVGRKRLKISFAKKEHHCHNEARDLEFALGMTGKARSPRTLHRLAWGGDYNGENLERADVQCARTDLAQGHACMHFSLKACISTSSFMDSIGHLTTISRISVP